MRVELDELLKPGRPDQPPLIIHIPGPLPLCRYHSDLLMPLCLGAARHLWYRAAQVMIYYDGEDSRGLQYCAWSRHTGVESKLYSSYPIPEIFDLREFHHAHGLAAHIWARLFEDHIPYRPWEREMPPIPNLRQL